MREFLSLYAREIEIGGAVLVLVMLIAGTILQRYLKDKNGPWTL